MKQTIAIVGNPNSGKSSVFNALTGLHQSVANFPGVTVDKKIGSFKAENGEEITLIDLPGLYSLYPNSSDEKLVVDILSNPADPNHPDLIVYVADSLQLERHMLLATQIRDLNIPLLFVANMSDIAEKEGVQVDLASIQKSLKVPMLSVSARTGQGIKELKKSISSGNFSAMNQKPFQKIQEGYKELASNIRNKLSLKINDYQSLIIAHHSEWLSWINPEQKLVIESLKTQSGFNPLAIQIDETLSRFTTFDPIIKRGITTQKDKPNKLSDRIDEVITHRIWGPLIFFSIMFLMFQALFSWASYPTEWIESFFAWSSSLVENALGDTWYASLLSDGIIAGIGGVMVFVPQIFLLFLMVAVLEEVGYMSRAVFMFDSILRKFGLNGRSMVALISGGACAIPAIMSTRTISNWKERLNTIMVTPLISCSARIPVYVVLVGFVVPDERVLGIFNMQGLAFMGLYLVSIISALGSAYVFKKILKSKEKSYLLIELPQYKKPLVKNVFLTLREKIWTFVWEAGKVIFVISIILWFLASYGPSQKMMQAEQEAIELASAKNYTEQQQNNLIASKKIEASYAGHLGKFIEPVIRPLGFDWKIGIALITSFAAREVFVGTMATIYAVGSDDEATIRERLSREINPATGMKMYSPAVAMSLLVFYLFAMQCMSTLAVTKRETKSWKWPAIQFVYMTGLAYLGSFLVYQLMS